MKSYEQESSLEAELPASDDATPAAEEVEDPSQLSSVAASSSEVEDRSSIRKSGFKPPTRDQLLLWVPFLAVFLLGAVLRFWGLGDKPLHHDESLHAYYSLQLLQNLHMWSQCQQGVIQCYKYDPLLHGPFQFHFIALVYQLSQWLGAADNGVNTTTVRILAATLGSLIVGLPYFLREHMGRIAALAASFLLAVSPSMVYFSRFAREDIYMAFFTLLLVVGAIRYLQTRKLRWLIISFAAFTFSYATKEATFLTVAVFGSFIGGILAWELGLPWKFPQGSEGTSRWRPRTFAPITVLGYVVLMGIVAKLFFGWLKSLSEYITSHPSASDVIVQDLKARTIAVIPYLGIVFGLLVLSILALEMLGKISVERDSRRASRLESRGQRLLGLLVSIPWTHWFFALITGCIIFVVLFTVVFTNSPAGIGDGVWQGLYYWLQQQQVARGGQPWYYYLILIPLYEQVGLVFGLAGIVYSLFRPTRFRLFLSYWALGNLFIYSWAAEKMPWLMIHIMLPLLLLGGIMLAPLLKWTWALILDLRARSRSAQTTEEESTGVQPRWSSRERWRTGTAVFGVVAALLLLLPTVHNMYEVSYVHAADGPHEMMIYVQTTTDLNIVMGKLDALDQKLYGGKHQLYIGVMSGANWPFLWYLRDYKHLCLSYPSGCSQDAQSVQAIIAADTDLPNAITQFANSDGGKGQFAYHQYHLRSWWSQGYMPPPCLVSPTNNCVGQSTWPGVGPWLWLSYGDTPPVGAKFNLGLAVQHVWQWWWERRPIGSTDGATDMGLFINSKLGVAP